MFWDDLKKIKRQMVDILTTSSSDWHVNYNFEFFPFYDLIIITSFAMTGVIPILIKDVYGVGR